MANGGCEERLDLIGPRGVTRDERARAGGKIGLDATGKVPPETGREWGRPIRMTDEMIAEVTSKWASYGLPGTGKPIWK